MRSAVNGTAAGAGRAATAAAVDVDAVVMRSACSGRRRAVARSGRRTSGAGTGTRTAAGACSRSTTYAPSVPANTTCSRPRWPFGWAERASWRSCSHVGRCSELGGGVAAVGATAFGASSGPTKQTRPQGLGSARFLTGSGKSLISLAAAWPRRNPEMGDTRSTQPTFPRAFQRMTEAEFRWLCKRKHSIEEP